MQSVCSDHLSSIFLSEIRGEMETVTHYYVLWMKHCQIQIICLDYKERIRMQTIELIIAIASYWHKISMLCPQPWSETENMLSYAHMSHTVHTYTPDLMVQSLPPSVSMLVIEQPPPQTGRLQKPKVLINTRFQYLIQSRQSIYSLLVYRDYVGEVNV